MSTRTSTASPSGHTLWELLLVLALLGGIAAVVAPHVATLRPAGAGDDLARTTQNVLDALAQARLTALDRGTSTVAVIDPAAARVWLYSTDGDDWRPLGTTTLATAPSVVLVADEPRVRFTFDPTGAGGGGHLTVRGTDAARVVSVDPWSGVAHAQSR